LAVLGEKLIQAASAAKREAHGVQPGQQERQQLPLQGRGGEPDQTARSGQEGTEREGLSGLEMPAEPCQQAEQAATEHRQSQGKQEAPPPLSLLHI